MSDNKPRSSILKIVCRCCKLELLKKNYKEHLSNKHPETDSNDLSAAGQMTLLRMFSDKRPLTESQPSNIKKLKVDNEKINDDDDDDDDDNIPMATREKGVILQCDKLISPTDNYETIQSRNVDDNDQDMNDDEKTLSTREKDVRMKCAELISTTTNNQEIIKTKDVASDNNTDPNDALNDASVHAKLDTILLVTNAIQESINSGKAKPVPNTNIDNIPLAVPNVPHVILMKCESIAAQIPHTRSLAEIYEFGFSYDDTDKTLICNACAKYSSNTSIKFSYDVDAGTHFDSKDKLPRSFVNLKKTLKRHVLTSFHVNLIHEIELKKAGEHKYSTRLHDVGMKVGRVAYHVCHSTLSFASFETELMLQNLNGVDIGDTNHSKIFARSLLPHFASKIDLRLKKFITTRLPQTGHIPAMNTSADKATYKHRTRQFVSLVTIIPDSPGLLQVIFVGIPVVKTGGTGDALCRNWKCALDSLQVNIKNGQIIFFIWK